eukprot:TRINITY_DN7057_c0_g1_i1.p3 TRINITY_DN7057_c0_g1~~TRINITY_DN7057_c0_g1_i1.p3  ORF type:complete len:104 (+),score=40.85 TRINITY_DN7057_c0_g1_i1:120-431(+)
MGLSDQEAMDIIENDDGVSKSLGITQSMAFCSLGYQYLLETGQSEQIGKPGEIAKMPFLDFLESKGLVGLSRFLHTYINKLSRRRVEKQKQAQSSGEQNAMEE